MRSNNSQFQSKPMGKKRELRMTLVCEGCLSEERLLRLSDTAAVEGSTSRYVDMFMSCFNLEILVDHEDSYTRFLCESCVRQLTSAVKFRSQVVRTQLELMQARIKKEDVEYDAMLESPLDFGEPIDVCQLEMKSFQLPNNSYDGDTSLWVKEEHSEELIDKHRRKYKKRIKRSFENGPDICFKKEIPQTKRTHTKRLKGDKRTKNELPMDPKSLICKLCEKKFENILTLQRHMAGHFPEHLCDICGNVYRKLEHLRIHLKSHNMVECHLCKSIMKEGSLKKHLELRHKSKKLYYMCSVCFEKFPTVSAKREHMAEKHGLDLGGKCERCNKTFAARSNLRMHIRSVHEKEVNVFCHNCGKGFLNSYALTRHMSKHTGVRNHVCEVCNKAYLKKDTLTAHMRIHKSEKEFICSLCAKEFTYKCSLKGHMKTHHPDLPFEG